MEEKQQNQGRTLQIVPGQVSRPVVEDILDEEFMESALFGRQYRQILSCLDEYVQHCRRNISNEPDKVFPNNVFTFVGERGSGKTSCMTSISGLLTSGRLRGFSGYKYLNKTQFTSVDLIDPSYFDESHNIVAFVVATLYKAFREKDHSNESNGCERDRRNELIDAFAHTQRSMRCLLGTGGNGQGEYESDDIDSLANLSSAIDLKDDIHRLVQSYLRFVKKDDGFLVLSIDDIDLNVSEADTMAEQIRKYLVNPNIVILLAAKLDQLATIKNLHYAEKYASLLIKNHIEYATIEEMTSQFLTKFAPHNQRVYMPTDEVYLNSGIKVQNDTWYGDNVTQVVPELIFNRTRYLFYNTKQTPSYIIPRNLRKLCQLVALLWSMKPYSEGNQVTNKDAFKKYLFGTWVQDNLSQDDRRRATRLLTGWRNGQLNKIALDVLQEKYKDWIDAKKKEETNNFDNGDSKKEIAALFDDRNREFNLSVGDIMSLIEVLEISFESHSDKCFFFFIKTIYSMALYEAYDIITEKQEIGEDTKDSTDEIRNDNNQVLLYDPFADEKIEDYHKLVGGRFYNYRLNPVLAKESIARKDKVSRSDRMINFKALNNLITATVKDWEYFQNDQSYKSETQKEELKEKVRFCEFFMLCCIRDINKRNAKSAKDSDFHDDAYRQNNSVYYNGKFTGIERLYFDLGAFFFNITEMERCYKRYNQGEDFWRLCKEDEKSNNNEEKISLYANWAVEAEKYRGCYKNPHAWQSWASIRNAEILLDLNQFLRSKCRLKEGENQKYLATYFKALSKYKIKTYDSDKEGTKLEINFEFASNISDLLNKVSMSNFDGIFSDYNNISQALSSKNIQPILVDVDQLLKRKKQSGNLKKTVREHLIKNGGEDVIDFESLVDEVLAQYGGRMTKDEVREVGNRLNELISSRYGDTQSSLENTVRPADPETDTGESEE